MPHRVHFRDLFAEESAGRFYALRTVRIKSSILKRGSRFTEGNFFSGLELATMNRYELEVEERPEEVLITAYYPRAS